MSITVANLVPPRVYAARRTLHQQQAIAYRRARSMHLGEHVLLQFEDERTVRYQIQEMLRAEGIDDIAGMQEQIDSYAALLPSGYNWKATLMLQIPDGQLRAAMRPRLHDIGRRVYLELAGGVRIAAIANEDLPAHDQRPSAVHFLRFEFSAANRAAIHAGDDILLGCEHPDLHLRVPMPAVLRAQLAVDLDEPAAAACVVQAVAACGL